MSDTMPKVLLAPNEQIEFDSEHLKWPLLGSRKYDGNRNVILAGEFRTRSMKFQANVLLGRHFKEIVEYAKSMGTVFDGELWSPSLTFTQLQEIVRARSVSIPDHVGFYVFDVMTKTQWVDGGEGVYRYRNETLREILEKFKFPRVFHVEQEEMTTPEEAEKAFDDFLTEGYEGLMLRSADGLYKHNRATHREGIIFKFKNFRTDDAQIVGATEMQKMKAEVRHGERERDVQGHLKRTHKQEDYEPADTIGSLIVKMKNGVEVGIGLGKRDSMEKKKIWEQYKRGELVGKWVEFSWMPHGTKDKPRIGKLERFRPDLD